MDALFLTGDKSPVLEGIAAGDALGLPYEGTIPKSVRWGFLCGWGVTSDDTQHASIALRALRECRGQTLVFRALLADYLAQWFCCISPGIGWGTLKACLKLCAGLEAPSSGSGSEGNGPLARAAVLGWEMHEDPRLDIFVEISTTTTHRGAAADNAARMLARVIAGLRKNPALTTNQLYEMCETIDTSPEWGEVMKRVRCSVDSRDFLASSGRGGGVSGHAYETFATALLVAGRRRRDLRGALQEVVLLGGDTDSVAAVTGAICAAMGGVVPDDWRKTIDWPVKKEPSLTRVFFNLFTWAGILLWHLPKRACTFFRR